MKFAPSLKAARSISTSIVACEGPDLPALVAAICGAGSTPGIIADEETQNGQKLAVAKIEWDLIRQLNGINPAGQAVVKALPATQRGFTVIDALRFMTSMEPPAFPARTVLLIHNAHLFLDMKRESGPPFVQALANFRDKGKNSGRMVILLGPRFSLPAEIKNDVLVLEQPLPSDEELTAIVRTEMDEAGVKTEQITPALLASATSALRGLASFPAKQVVAMNVSRKTGISIEGLWERTNTEINRTRGLSVVPKGPGLAAIGGLEQAKFLLGKIFTGNNKPSVVVFMDEIEKAFAGTGTDTSGVATELTGQTLTEMESQGYIGIILVGFPGGGKSAIASAIGSEYNARTVLYNLSQMKSGIVGSSMENLVEANRVIRAISGGGAFFIGTCNSLGVLPPELLRRFTVGIMFVDLPDQAERDMIWPIWLKKYSLDATMERPDTQGWTGANIKQCCDLAYRMNVPLTTAADFVIPITRSAPERVEALRGEAVNKYLSASYPGPYVLPTGEPTPASGMIATLGGGRGRRARTDS